MNKKFLYLLLTFLSLTACSLSTNLDASIEREVKSITDLREKAKAPTTISPTDTVRVKDDIWLGDTSVVEYEGQPLPSILEKPDAITLVSSRPVSLFEIGDMITKVTSLSIRFSDDVESEALAEARANTPTVEKMGADWAAPGQMILSYRGPLNGLLDEVCSRFGLWWKYENNTLYFYRQITKTFVVYSLPSQTSLSANVGGSSSGSGGSSSISLSNSAQVELWSNIEKAVASIAGSNSSITADSSNGTITVTAKPTEIAKVAKFINEQNVRLSRQVAISVKVLQVSIEDTDNYGLNLTAALSGSDIATSALTGTTIGTENLSLSVVKGDFNFAATMEALSSQGTTTLVTSGTVTTLNNKPAPIQVVKSQTYISEVTISSSSSIYETSDVSTETSEVETGFTLDVLPRILEHNRLLVLFNLTLSSLLNLETVQVGDGYIQTPEVESRGFSQEVALKSGDTLILSGFERVETATSKSGVGSANNSLLGGSATATKTRTVLVILLTPVVLESPLNPESRMNVN